MLTAETTLERSPEAVDVPASDGWYDPDSIVFQATVEDEAGSRSPVSATRDGVRADDRELIGAGR